MAYTIPFQVQIDTNLKQIGSIQYKINTIQIKMRITKSKLE